MSFVSSYQIFCSANPSSLQNQVVGGVVFDGVNRAPWIIDICNLRDTKAKGFGFLTETSNLATRFRSISSRIKDEVTIWNLRPNAIDTISAGGPVKAIPLSQTLVSRHTFSTDSYLRPSISQLRKSRTYSRDGISRSLRSFTIALILRPSFPDSRIN